MNYADAGHAVQPGVFAAAEMRALIRQLSAAALVRTRAGARHVLGIPVVNALASDAHMLAIARAFIGDPPMPFRAKLFDKSPAANWLVVWHQDTALPLRHRVDEPGWGGWSTKNGVLYAHAPASALERVVALRVGLDDSTLTNGPLRVLPDTHRGGVLTDERIAQLARRVSPVDCIAPRGSVVGMRPLLVHASSKMVSPTLRRVLHIEYAVGRRLGSELELALAWPR